MSKPPRNFGEAGVQRLLLLLDIICYVSSEGDIHKFNIGINFYSLEAGKLIQMQNHT